jgi:hypothetical protein
LHDDSRPAISVAKAFGAAALWREEFKDSLFRARLLSNIADEPNKIAVTEDCGKSPDVVETVLVFSELLNTPRLLYESSKV